MNDAERRLAGSRSTGKLLEAPVPAQPVVMIEYRNRGVPWWLLGSLIVLLPRSSVRSSTISNSVVERYRARAAKAEYLAEAAETVRAG